MSLRDGNFIEKNVIEQDIPDRRVTDNSVYLRLDSVRRINDGVVLDDSGSHRNDNSEVPRRTRAQYNKRGKADASDVLRKHGWSPDSEDEFFYLTGDAYTITLQESIDIPSGHLGMIKSRADLLKVGASIESSVLHPKSQITEFLLDTNTELLVECDSVVAELVLFRRDKSIGTKER